MKITDWIKQFALFIPSFIIAIIPIKGIFLNGEIGFLELFIILLGISILLLAIFLKQNKVYYTILCLGLLLLMGITYYRAANFGSLLFAIVVLFLMYRLHRFDKQEALEK